MKQCFLFKPGIYTLHESVLSCSGLYIVNLHVHAQRSVTVGVEYVCLSVCARLISETPSRTITKRRDRKPFARGNICVKSLPKALQG